jgi:membrane-bound lytic murein transglycosylase A
MAKHKDTEETQRLSSGNSPFLRPENMVHQTMKTSSTKAPKASSSSHIMKYLLSAVLGLVIVGTFIACTARRPATSYTAPRPIAPPDHVLTQLSPLMQSKSRWTPVDWIDLLALREDSLSEAWSAWLASCERPGPAFILLCGDVRRLTLSSQEEKLDWMMARLQPYRVDALDEEPGLLTAYYEPQVEASRLPKEGFRVPLYQPPASLGKRRPWYTRQEMETLEEVQSILRGQEIAYVSDPVTALNLQIQGSGRLVLTEPNGSQRLVRVAYAASNDHPYRSVARWLLDQDAIREGSWAAIKTWVAQNPSRINDMLWSNPRVVFFREQPLSEAEAAFGPRGAQGVALTPGRSIAVDPLSIPYGTPVWMQSIGPQGKLQKLVLAQDTGSAITGAVRADYFTGWGEQAGEIANRIKQPLRLWVLWPR